MYVISPGSEVLVAGFQINAEFVLGLWEGSIHQRTFFHDEY